MKVSGSPRSDALRRNEEIGFIQNSWENSIRHLPDFSRHLLEIPRGPLDQPDHAQEAVHHPVAAHFQKWRGRIKESRQSRRLC